jgi:NADH-quinone oxidoreductase subunit I
MNKKEISVNEVEFAQIEQNGPKNLFNQMQGFWVTFATMFKKVNNVSYPEVKEPTA